MELLHDIQYTVSQVFYAYITYTILGIALGCDTSMYPIEVDFCVVNLRRSICTPPFSTAGVPVSPDRW